MEAEVMWGEYLKVIEGKPLATNSHFDSQADGARDMLIVCHCGVTYRVEFNGDTPISWDLPDVFCPNCGQSANNRRASMGHSAGVFNVMAG
jgi:hypothetical protein